jgi:transposase
MNKQGLTKADLLSKKQGELADLVINLAFIIRQKDAEIETLKELQRLRTAERYVPSTEQMGYLFEELELLDSVLRNEVSETLEVTVSAHTKQVRKRLNACTAPSDTPVVDVYHDKDAEPTITIDGIIYDRIGDKIIDKLAVIPRKYVVERNHYPQYRARQVEMPKIIIGLNKAANIGGSPSLVANTIVSKFDDHLPLYRQEEIFRREGIFLSRQKLANWVITYYEQLLPFASFFKRQLYDSNLISKDETKVQVLNVKGPDGKPSKSGFMYITIGETYNPDTRRTKTLVMLDYIQGRSKNILFEDMDNYKYDGYLMTDGLTGYLSYPQEKHGVCWVHGVRRFKAILKDNPKNVQAARVVSLASQLFKVEKELRGQLHEGNIEPNEFLALRKEQCQAIIDSVFEEIDQWRTSFTPGGAMGKAIAYLDKYKNYLNIYLDVLEATPSTNNCERVAKSFATGRKNWLFSETVDGADASAFFYSLIETAKFSNLDPLDYIEAICTFGIYAKSEEEWMALLPERIDLTALYERRAQRSSAKANPTQEKPYHFVGHTK